MPEAQGESLKPCPFCDEADVTIYKPAMSRLFAAYCEECEVKGPLATNEAGARDAWNTRPAPQSTLPSEDALVEAVARALVVADGEDPDEETLPGRPEWVLYIPNAHAALTATRANDRRG